MNRRRVFDIDLPDEAEGDAPSPAPTPAPGSRRRGPMASAVRESAESLKVRQDTEAAVRAENDALAHELVRLRSLGLVVESVPVDRIDAGKLVRDRKLEDEPDLDDLKTSILAIGLSNPIRVEAQGERYELIQGWRRLRAYRALHAETGDDAWSAIPAGIVAPGDDLEVSYRRMVDENLVRKDISFAEMAELARAYATDPQTACGEVEDAVSTLFRSAPYQKRSYIRAFAQLLDMVGEALRFPAEIPRNLGLEVRKRLAEEKGAAGRLSTALAAEPERDAAREASILREFVRAGADAVPLAKRERAKAPATGRLSFPLSRPTGETKCTVSGGRLELRGQEDFSAFERDRLEKALAAFFRVLDR